MNIPRFVGALVVAATWIAPVTAQNNYVDQAHLATSYKYYGLAQGKVELTDLRETAIIVTTRHWLPEAAINNGTAFSIRDLTQPQPVKNPKVFQLGAFAIQDGAGVNYYNWFVVSGGFDAGADYEVTIHYRTIGGWDDNGAGTATPAAGPLTDVTKAVQRLTPGQEVKANHTIGAASSTQPDLGGVEEAGGFGKILKNGSLFLIPETSEETDVLGLRYGFDYDIDNQHYAGSIPRNFSLKARVEGRQTTRSSSERAVATSFAGYSNGDISAQLMLLPGTERYYPLGVRVAGGYESGESFDNARATASAHGVASLPYLGDLLLEWHEVIGVNRPFAPPFVSAGYVYSDNSDSADIRQSRFEIEAGWNIPIADRWDVDLSFRYFDFRADGLEDETLFEGEFIYYPGEDRDHGISIRFEEGFRPVLGDIGSTLIIGYTIKGF